MIEGREAAFLDPDYGLQKELDLYVKEGKLRFMKEMAFVSFRGMKEGGLGFGCYQEAVLNYKIYSKI